MVATLHRIATAYEEPVYSIVRVFIGFLFMQHGAQKLFGLFGGVSGSNGTASLISMYGVAGIIEFVGGLLLVIGLLTRLVALVTAAEMVGAQFIVCDKRSQDANPRWMTDRLPHWEVLFERQSALLGERRLRADHRPERAASGICPLVSGPICGSVSRATGAENVRRGVARVSAGGTKRWNAKAREGCNQRGYPLAPRAHPF